MWFFDRQKLSKSLREFGDIVGIIDDIKAMQTAQRELAEKVELLNNKVLSIESELRVVRAEVARDALRETQVIVNSVQGGLNQRLQDIAVDVALLRREVLYRGRDDAVKEPPSGVAKIGRGSNPSASESDAS